MVEELVKQFETLQKDATVLLERLEETLTAETPPNGFVREIEAYLRATGAKIESMKCLARSVKDNLDEA